MNAQKKAFNILILAFLAFKGHVIATNSSFEKTLRDELFGAKHYDKAVRPVKNPTKPVNVSFGLRLSKLVELNSKHQLLVTDVWITQKWRNPFLAWNESKYGGIHSLHLTPSDVWVPDVVLYNNGDTAVSLSGFTEKFKTFIIVESSGQCSWMSPATFKSSCSMDITHFPFDRQTCEMTFGLWTYDDRMLQMIQLDLQHTIAEKFVPNGDWKLEAITIKRQKLKYACCVHPFSDVTYTFILKRKPSYHILYLIIPCVIIASLSLVNFYLPPNCGERIGLCVTILLAMSVYLLLVADILPETSDYIPLLGVYYMSTMVEVGLCIAATGVTLRCTYARGKPPKYLMWFGGCKKQKTFSKNAVVAVTSVYGEEVNRKPESTGKSKPSQEMESESDRAAWRECWIKIAHRLDLVFLVLFAIIFLLTTLVVLIP